MGEINHGFQVKICKICILKGVEVAFISEIAAAMCTLTSTT